MLFECTAFSNQFTVWRRFSPNSTGLVPFDCTTYDGVLPCDCILTAREMRSNTPAATVTATASAALKLLLNRLLRKAAMGQDSLA